MIAEPRRSVGVVSETNEFFSLVSDTPWPAVPSASLRAPAGPEARSPDLAAVNGGFLPARGQRPAFTAANDARGGRNPG